MTSLSQSFERDGYLVIERVYSDQECLELIARAAALVNDFDPEETRSIFSTTEAKEERDAYFLESGDKIRFFWEKDAFAEDGSLRLTKEQAINKIGHALHDLDPVFHRLSRIPKLKDLTTALGMTDPLLVQSMYIFKHPGVGGEVGWHQDQTYLHTSPGSVVGLWIALDDATIENGCLWAIPGGHRGPLRSRFIRTGFKQETATLDTSPWEIGLQRPLEVKRGSVIVLHGLLPHMSEANTSGKPRQAYTLHVMERSAEYSTGNWLQRSPELPFTGFES